MKNKSVLVVAGIFALAVSAGSYQYYKDKVQSVSMSYNEAQIITNLYIQQNVCSVFGLTQTNSNQDLLPLIKRIQINNVKQHFPKADKNVAKLKVDFINGMVDEKVAEVKALYQSSEGVQIDFMEDAAFCEQTLYKAQNILSRYR